MRAASKHKLIFAAGMGVGLCELYGAWTPGGLVALWQLAGMAIHGVATVIAAYYVGRAVLDGGQSVWARASVIAIITSIIAITWLHVPLRLRFAFAASEFDALIHQVESQDSLPPLPFKVGSFTVISVRKLGPGTYFLQTGCIGWDIVGLAHGPADNCMSRYRVPLSNGWYVASS